MGSNADHTTKQARSTSVALPPENARKPVTDLEEQPAAVRQLSAQSTSQPNTKGWSDARSGSPPSPEPALTEGQGFQEAQLQPLQDADLVGDFSLPSPHPTAQSESSLDRLIGSPATDHSRPVEPASSLPGTTAAVVSQRKPAVPGARSSPFASGHSTDSASSNVEQAPPQAGIGVQAPPEVPANSSLQPATPPLHTPTGQTPASRPASEQEGEPPPTGAARQGSLQGIAKGIQAAIERKLSVGVFRRHPPEDMEDMVPRLSSVAAEIETPGQSPRSGLASPHSGILQSGDSFTKAFMHQARRLRTAVLHQKVNFSDVAHNPSLARAARAELDGRSPAHNAFTESGNLQAGRPHDAEVERQREALLAVDTEAEEESTINRELAHVICSRMDAARRATERLLGVLQACANAEAAYTRTLTAASKVKLVGDCDGASVRGALDGFSDLPFMIGQAHLTIGAGLSDTTKSMQDVVSALRVACVDIGGESVKVHKAIDSSRRGLQSAFVDHQAACRISDDSALERAKGRAVRPFLESADPWLTEARVVAAHGALHKAQASERDFLTRAFTNVKDLELRRIAAIRDVIAAFAEAYRWGLSAVKADTAPLLRSAEQIDGEADLEELTASSEAAAETGATLVTRQADALEAASQELLCSPEVTRQGEMARWVSGSGKWMDCHCVLTRCGFLHWFAGSPPDPADIVPADSLNLSRCQFETGEAQAQEFNLLELAAGVFGRSRRLIFKASSMEECCEWAIVLREAIAESSRK